MSAIANTKSSPEERTAEATASSTEVLFIQGGYGIRVDGIGRRMFPGAVSHAATVSIFVGKVVGFRKCMPRRSR